jgi:hypothetical protein
MSGTALAAAVRSKFNLWPTGKVVGESGMSATG